MLRSYGIGVGAIVTLAIAGCGRHGSPQETRASSRARSAVSGPVTPGATVEHIHALRNQGRYAELGAFVERSQAASVIDFSLAMDELLAANDAVQAAIRQHMPTAAAAKWDLSSLKDSQELFAPQIKVIDERVEEPQAWVTIQVGDTMPLNVVPMRHVGDRWVYWPESEVGRLPEALRGLSQALRRVASVVACGTLTETDLQTEFRLRVSPQLKTIEYLATEQQHAAAPGRVVSR